MCGEDCGKKGLEREHSNRRDTCPPKGTKYQWSPHEKCGQPEKGAPCEMTEVGTPFRHAMCLENTDGFSNCIPCKEAIWVLPGVPQISSMDL